jgi:hypothetical protein
MTIVTSKGIAVAAVGSLSVAEMEVFTLFEVCVTPPTSKQAKAFPTSVPVKDQAVSVETPPVSPSLKRNPLKDFVVLLTVMTVLVLTGNVVVLPAARVTPPREIDKPPSARDPVVGFVK